MSPPTTGPCIRGRHSIPEAGSWPRGARTAWCALGPGHGGAGRRVARPRGLCQRRGLQPRRRRPRVRGADGAVRLWDATAHTPLAVLRGHTAPVHRVAFSGDGSLIASASQDRTVRLWDVRTCRGAPPVLTHGSVIYGLAFSPDGTRLATGFATTRSACGISPRPSRSPSCAGTPTTCTRSPSAPTAPGSSPAPATLRCGSGTRWR